MNPHTHETQPFNSIEDAKAAGHVVPVETTAPKPAQPNRKRRRKGLAQHGLQRFKPEELGRHLRHQAEEKEKKRRKAKATAKMKRMARQKAR